MNIYSDASNLVRGVDTAFIIIFSAVLFFLVSVSIVIVVFIFKYNNKRHPKAVQIEGNIKLEIIWTLIPLLLVMGMFYFGWTGWKPQVTEPPEDSFNIEVTARMWKWDFAYENGKRLDTMYVPQGVPIAIDLKSVDVVHSFYIPAFRLKQDVVPGYKTVRWFIGNKPGDYDLFCAEYCGLNHSYMYTTVKVLPKADFDKWYTDTTAVVTTAGAAATPASEGMQLVQRYGCNACHSADGTRIIGPSYKGIFGHETVVIENGQEKTVMVDEEYLKNSIYDPNSQIVKGFNRGLMQSYKGQVSEEELEKIIEYIKSLQ